MWSLVPRDLCDALYAKSHHQLCVQSYFFYNASKLLITIKYICKNLHTHKLAEIPSVTVQIQYSTMYF